MKKLLSLLTITSLTASVPTPLLANTVQTRVKRDVGVSNSNTDNILIKMNGIDGENNSIIKDKNNNFYFGTNSGAFVLKQGETTPTKINAINNVVYSIAVDNSNNIYYGTDDGAFVLKQGETTPTKINAINNVVYSIAVDNNDNVYIGTTGGLYKLPSGSTVPTKINGINGWINFVFIDKSNNVYIGTTGGLYKLPSGSTVPTKINGINTLAMVFDSKNNILFSTNDGIYKLPSGSTVPTKINGINENVIHLSVDSDNNIYFTTRNNGNDIMVLNYGNNISKKIVSASSWINSIIINNKNELYFGTNKGTYIMQTALSWLKQQSKFILVDSSKTQTWTRPDLLTVDGETNININNPNVEEVYLDGAKQNMLGGKVSINVKPETSEKNHNLQVIFTLDGKQYTGEIIVSMLAKIDPNPTPDPKQLNELIKNNDLGNIVDNNDDTIKAKVVEKNSLAIDFSQIEITDKTDTQATLKVRDGSKSYAGLVVVKYNVISSTTVDLKIDLTSSASGVQIDKDYLAQLDSSKMTNKVDTFYYANGKSTIKIKQPLTGNVINGKIYGCDERWNKTSQSSNIDPTSGLKIDKGQYGSVDGHYLIELQHKNLPTHTKTIYLQISEKQNIWNYFDTDNGKQFEQWAEDNGEKNIRGSSASKLNNLFEVSKTWKQSLKNLDIKLDNFVVANIKNVTQDEIDTYKTKMLAIVKEQVEQYASNVVENIDYVISVDNLVAGDWTASKDVKVQSVSGSTKLLSFAIKTLPVQQKDEPTPDPNQTSTPTPDNKKGSDSKLWIIGVVVGVLAGIGIAYWLFKRFVFDKYFLPKIKKRRHLKLVEQVRKEEAEKNAREQAQENRELDDEQNNKGGDE